MSLRIVTAPVTGTRLSRTVVDGSVNPAWYVKRPATKADWMARAGLIRESLPDVVVSDIRMPDIDGHELVSILKADPATAHIPVLLMSGHEIAGKNSCDAFLSKPFLLPELQAAVQKLAQRSAGA